LVLSESKKALSWCGLPDFWCTFFGGGIAGAASVFANTPVDVIKTNMQGL